MMMLGFISIHQNQQGRWNLGPGGLTPPPPQILADQFTLFQLGGGADYAHHIT